MRAKLGTRFVAGVIFTTGPLSYTHEDRLHVMPIDRLWRTIPASPTNPSQATPTDWVSRHRQISDRW